MQTTTPSGMDFFGHQERARRLSRRLVLLFGLAVVAIIGCIHAATVGLLVAIGESNGWHPELLAVTALATLTIVGGASAWKVSQLRAGGPLVAAQLGGRRVPPETQDPKERMLRNLVEEMAIASGVPVPAVFVLDQEPGINAFAAGWGTADAAIAVTRGSLEQFDRDELQGVVAHEFSHIFHGDMRLNMRLMGVLFGILCIAMLGRVLLQVGARGGGGNRRGNQAAALLVFGVAMIAIGYLGVFFARLIQAAVSRQREFLADASAVQYTRNPRGIGMALAKIGGFGGALRSAHAEEASHMMFADGMKRFFGGVLATHPPLRERVARVLPGIRLPQQDGAAMVDAVATAVVPAAVAQALAPPPPHSHQRPATQRGPAIAARSLLQSIGEPTSGHVAAAAEWLAALPLELLSAAREPRRTPALVLALLLDADPARRQQQLAPIQARDGSLSHEMAHLQTMLAREAPQARLPLLELALPNLRQLPAPAVAQLRNDARALAYADGELLAFEFALLKTMERHLPRPGEHPPRPHGRPRALLDLPRPASLVLAALAQAGAHGDRTAAQAAFAAGVAELPGMAAQSMPDLPRGLAELEDAVQELAAVSPFGKRSLLAACARAAGADGRLTGEEVDLLRALAEYWDCPIPLATRPDGTPVALS
jgi:Zn-dependent protease with chaperone function